MTKRLTAMGCGILMGLVIGTARGEVVVVVSEQSPVEGLSRKELVDIYLGRMNRFPSGDPVIPVDQKESSPEHDEFYNEYLGRTPAQVKAHWSKLIFTGRGQPPRSVSNGDAAADFVADNPNAIGYVDPALVDGRLRIVNIE